MKLSSSWCDVVRGGVKAYSDYLEIDLHLVLVHCQEECTNPPQEGFRIQEKDIFPRILGISCEAAPRCAQNIFTKGF